MNALKEKQLIPRPQLVLAHANAGYAKSVGRYYQRLGWETHLATSALEARRMVRELTPEVVVLGTDLPDESGWLTCDKLLDENPEQKIVLVTDQSTPANRRFANFVGATALVNEEGGVQALADEVGGPEKLSVVSC